MFASPRRDNSETSADYEVYFRARTDLGMQITPGKHPRVESVISSGVAFAAGVEVGDRLVSTDGKAVDLVARPDLADLLRRRPLRLGFKKVEGLFAEVSAESLSRPELQAQLKSAMEEQDAARLRTLVLEAKGAGLPEVRQAQALLDFLEEQRVWQDRKAGRQEESSRSDTIQPKVIDTLLKAIPLLREKLVSGEQRMAKFEKRLDHLGGTQGPELWFKAMEARLDEHLSRLKHLEARFDEKYLQDVDDMKSRAAAAAPGRGNEVAADAGAMKKLADSIKQSVKHEIHLSTEKIGQSLQKEIQYSNEKIDFDTKKKIDDMEARILSSAGEKAKDAVDNAVKAEVDKAVKAQVYIAVEATVKPQIKELNDRVAVVMKETQRRDSKRQATPPSGKASAAGIQRRDSKRSSTSRSTPRSSRSSGVGSSQASSVGKAPAAGKAPSAAKATANKD